MDASIFAPRLRVECPELPDETYIIGLEGTEAIHELFEYRVLVELKGNETLDPTTVIGSQIAVVMETDEARPTEVRRLHGLVARCEDFLRPSSSLAYRLRVVPRMWLSTLIETLEIYQEMSVVDIITAKLEAINLTSGTDFEFRLKGSYAKREFVVQYKETDLAFISRLCEHIGISFFFEHRDGIDVAVFTDSQWGFQPIEGDASIEFHARGSQKGVFELQREAQIVPSNFLQRDYNYRNPSTDLLAEDKFEGFGGGIIEYGGHFRDPGEGQALAAVRRQERECRQLTYQGKAADSRINPGQRFTVSGHIYGDLELLPIRTHIKCKSADLDGGDAAANYEVSFEATDANLTFRPLRKTPRPYIKGVLTGIIDAAGPGQYAEVDDWGRYKVRFMFDTSGPDGGKASRPVRMMQPHSGGGYGMHFPLRGGVEVLITFMDGDPDRPIIAGTVPNPQTPSPVAAGNARRNVIRTGAGNEMNIDDTKGSERIKFTVPHAGTVFQLGAPNLAESGVALQTSGAWTSTATSGISSITSFQAGISALSAWWSSGNIVSEASKADLKKLVLGTATFANTFAAVAASALAAYKGAVELGEKKALKHAVDSEKPAREKYKACDACAQDLAQKADKLPSPYKAEAKKAAKARQDAADAHADSLDTRRKRDQSREASVGYWMDQNEVAHTRRDKKLNQQYADDKKDAKEKMAAAETAGKKASTKLDAAANDDNLTADQKKDVAAFQSALGDCGTSCAGLDEAQKKADAELEKYHKLRSKNSDEHKWIASTEKSIGRAQVVTGAAQMLASAYMSIATFAKRKEASVKLQSRWTDIMSNISGSGFGNQVSIKPVTASTPLHSVGAAGSATLHGADVAIEGKTVGIFADGGQGHAAVTASKCASLSSKERTVVTSWDLTRVHGKKVTIDAHNEQDGHLKLNAKKNIEAIAVLEDIQMTTRTADRKIKFMAGEKGPDPKFTLNSGGEGLVVLETHEWKLQAKKTGLDLGKKDSGEMKLDADQALFKKKGTSIKLEDDTGTLEGEKWHIKGENTKVYASKQQITLDAGGRINIESGAKIEMTAKAIIGDAPKIDMG